ncbi:hypothetical protein BLNAU_20800 [Blattamonas nauphoetae]|uniref:Uncharacterized protein n=1 Tax=Blattamonas nauphoetae TaxID=2049346 RepID=A0ABQ9WYU7_9EUKA|nr:hypothetical protein BLNAU_20800 [Blattamonas nauphoetae]
MLDVALEAKAIVFLESVDRDDKESADVFINSFGRTTDESVTNFVQSIGVLVSCANKTLTTATMKMVNALIYLCSAKVSLALITADLIPQLIIALNILSLSFVEAEEIHTNLMKILHSSLWLPTPYGFAELEIDNQDDRQAVCETIYQQVLIPSEKFICDLCRNRNSITERQLSDEIMTLPVWLLRIAPYYQPTMDFVVRMPIFATIPSGLASIETDDSISYCLSSMVDIQREWNKKIGEVRQMWKILHRVLRMEGLEDAVEEKLRFDKTTDVGMFIVAESVQWNNLLGMNTPRRRLPQGSSHSTSHSPLLSSCVHSLRRPGTTFRQTFEADCFDDHCSAFLNWDEEEPESGAEKAVVFQSLVTTMKLQTVLDDSLEAKAILFLESMAHIYYFSRDAFLSNFASLSDNSSTNFVQSIVVLLSTPKQTITTATMEMLSDLIFHCSPKVHLTIVKANLVPQIITTLNPLSLSFTESGDIHTYLMKMLRHSFWLPTPRGLAELKIEDGYKQLAVHKTVLKQVIAPSEMYICHLCVNRFSIVNRQQSKSFLELLTRLLQICPYYQRTVDIVLHMPVILTIPSCLTVFEDNCSIWSFLVDMNATQREWNQTKGDQRQMWKTLHRQLRMEGIEDVIETKLRNDKNASYGRSLVSFSIGWSNLLGMNPPYRCTDITSYFARTVWILARQSSSMIATPSITFAATLALLLFGIQYSRPLPHPSLPTSHSLCLSLTTHTLPLPLPLPHHPHPPTPLCLSSPPTPSLSLCLSLTHTLPLPLPLPHHPHPPTPLCLSLTTHTLPLPSASPSPPTPSHSLCLSLTTHTLPLPLPLPHHPHPPTPLCLSLTTHTSHSPLPLPHHPHPPSPLCLSLTTHTLPLPSASHLTALVVPRAVCCSFEDQEMLASNVFLLRLLLSVVVFFTPPSSLPSDPTSTIIIYPPLVPLHTNHFINTPTLERRAEQGRDCGVTTLHHSLPSSHPFLHIPKESPNQSFTPPAKRQAPEG